MCCAFMFCYKRMKKKKLSLNWRKCQYLIFLNYKEMSNWLKKSKKEWKQKPNWKEACLSMYLIHTSIMMMFSTEFLLKNNTTKYGYPLWILLSQQYQTRQLLSEMTHFHLQIISWWTRRFIWPYRHLSEWLYFLWLIRKGLTTFIYHR